MKDISPNETSIETDTKRHGIKTANHSHPRMTRELKTIRIMIDLYCRKHHSPAPPPCSECQDLLTYATLRLKHCPFKENKTTCGNCAIHCYKPSYRQTIREIMRYAGPRMLWTHPLLAIGHMIDGFCKRPTQGSASEK